MDSSPISLPLEIIAAAPFFTASGMKSCPSNLFPGIATKIFPLQTDPACNDIPEIEASKNLRLSSSWVSPVSNWFNGFSFNDGIVLFCFISLKSYRTYRASSDFCSRLGALPNYFSGTVYFGSQSIFFEGIHCF